LKKATDNGEKWTAEQKRQFIELNKELKLLMDRRSQIVARTGDEYLMDPPKLMPK